MGKIPSQSESGSDYDDGTAAFDVSYASPNPKEVKGSRADNLMDGKRKKMRANRNPVQITMMGLPLLTSHMHLQIQRK